MTTSMHTPTSSRRRPPARRRRPALLLLFVLALAASACGGGDDASAAEGVASLATETVGTAGTGDGDTDGSDAEVTEEDLLDWVECMRGEGIDIDDPTVDADGNLTLAPPGGGARPGTADAGADGGGLGQRDDAGRQEAFDACGEPPLQRGGFEFSDEDQTELQDQSLVLAQCLRDLGHDVADPSLDDGPGGLGAMFGALDREDPSVQADLEACQAEAFGEDGAPFRGAGGPGGRGAAGGQGQ